MRRARETAVGAARWVGLFGGAAELGDVTIVSPHLDDAVLSVGAAVSRAARRGARVTILTVLAGDPDSTSAAGEWDAQAGFATAGDAARARRTEDARACRTVGAEPVWLPFCDDQYPRGATNGEIRAAIVEATTPGSVLLPGFPLAHDDHRWVNELLVDAYPRERIGMYVEQPYAAWAGTRPTSRGWTALRADLRDRRRKLAACRAYRSQLRPLGDPLSKILRHELLAGGESAAWTKHAA